MTFTVMMLDELRPHLTAWLNAQGFELVHVPLTEPDAFIVVPSPRDVQ